MPIRETIKRKNKFHFFANLFRPIEHCFLREQESRFIMKRFISIFLGIVMSVNVVLPCFADNLDGSAASHNDGISDDISEELSGKISDEKAAKAAGEFVGRVLEYIYSDYMGGDIDLETLIQGAVRGMTDELDDYSEFFTPEEYYGFYKDIVANEVYMIGVKYVTDDDGYAYVVDIVKDSAAEKAKIKPGDVIKKINDEDIKDKNLVDIVNELTLKQEYKIKLGIERDGKLSDVVVDLTPVGKKSVTSLDLKKFVNGKVDNDIAFIRIDSFILDTNKEFKTVMDEELKKGKKKLILDLRSNGGGIIDEAELICDYLIKGEIAHLKARNGEVRVSSELEGEPPFESIVILTDCVTASAAELLTMALKENGAVTVGQKTFGKGVVQEVVPLSDIGFLKMTVQEYFSKTNKKINTIGIDPDYDLNIPRYIIHPEDIDTDSEELKTILEYLGYSCKTEDDVIEAVKQIQKLYSLRETGVADETTAAAVNSELSYKVNSEGKIVKKAYEVIKDM